MSTEVESTTLVVPCYNEAGRLRTDAWLELLDCDPEVALLFVNDGSSDDTLAILERLAADHDRASVLNLARNQGKAEAVRLGLFEACNHSEIVGFADADLATPTSELLRLLETLRLTPNIRVLIGARVALAGRTIERKAFRHYLGRVFSTMASLTLRQRIYDTQCGAKFFRRSQALLEALSEPFLSRWVFDVELLGRLYIGSGTQPGLQSTELLEVPLQEWVDPGGSKVQLKDMVRSAGDLARIELDFRRRRRR